MKLNLIRFGWACAALVLIVGCGSDNLPGLSPVSGVVTLDGQPLPRGSVQFSPDNAQGNTGPAAIGFISANGEYVLQTTGARGPVKGAIAGAHRVQVESRAAPKNEMDTLPASLIPEKYNDPSTSGLTYTVVKGANTFNIELKSN